MQPDPKFDLNEALARIAPVRRPPLYVRAWYARHAILLGGFLPAGLVQLGVAAHPTAPAGVATAAGIAYAATPELQRWVFVRTRCIWMDRRIRTTFRRGRICGPDGRLPVVLWVAPTPAGVYVHVLVPIGMRAELILRAKGRIQDATGASEVVMFREAGRRQVVIGLTFEQSGRWWEG
jgi:hypothetical protein